MHNYQAKCNRRVSRVFQRLKHANNNVYKFSFVNHSAPNILISDSKYYSYSLKYLSRLRFPLAASATTLSK
jgi:hypothetical protein